MFYHVEFVEQAHRRAPPRVVDPNPHLLGRASGMVPADFRCELAVGESVTVAIAAGGADDRETFIIGKVVRVGDAADDGTRKIGIEFLRPVPELEALFTRASDRPPRDG